MRSLLVLALLLCSLAFAAPASAGSGAPPAHVVQALGGLFLTDGFGRRLEFHAMNLVPECGPHTKIAGAPGAPCIPDPHGNAPGWYLTADNPDPAYRFTDADAETLREAGVDLIRLGIHWEALEPGSTVGPNDPRYCAQLTPSEPHDPSLGAAVWDPAVADEYLARVDARSRPLRATAFE